jgi:two-component sensor histidine kinase
MNSTCEQVWTMRLSDCKGKLDRELHPVTDAARLRADDLSVLETSCPSRIVEELSLPNGEVRHLLSYRFPFVDVAGSRILGGISVDITDQMRTERALAAALAAQQTLLKEVHHRVKNNLQIVSSLLNMQSELLTDPLQRKVFQDSQQRVQAMAMIHDRLCGNSNLDQVDFLEYVEALARDMFTAYSVNCDRVRLRLVLEPVSLDLNQAMPCGLILNELITNALKYAFPGTRTGELLIGLRCDEEGSVALRVEDDGVGMPASSDRRRTLGLEIVDVLTRQLGGTLTREAGPGVHSTLVFEKAGPKPVTKPIPTKTVRLGS